jgi:hypothetical protein
MLVACGCLGLAAVAVAPAHSAPVEERHGSVSVLHGGVGAEERAAMHAQAAHNKQQLTIAGRGRGEYQSAGKVTIRDARGAAVLETTASGPWLFARLPAGEYSIAAQSAGQTLTQKLSIPGAGRRDWVFRFESPAGPQ